MRPPALRYERVTYLIQQGEDGPVKIGSTAGDPYARMAALQIGNPQTLELLWVFLEDIEAQLHRELDAYRLQGEWFDTRALDHLRREYGQIP